MNFKYIFALHFVLATLFSTLTQAQSVVSNETSIIQGIFEDHQDLFPILMPDYAIQNNYDETKKSFVVHFRDSFGIYKEPQTFRRTSLKPDYTINDGKDRPIKGTMTYVGFFKAKYLYDLKFDGIEYTFRVNVHFKNPNSTDIAEFSRRVQAAQDIWNDQYKISKFIQEYGIDFKFRFEFNVVKNAKEAHFSVNVADDTRGPYYSEWSRRWTSIAIAHEIGHMLGLGDEYDTLSSNDDCLDQSLMCQSWTGELMNHHYYHVIKRLF